MKNMKKQLLQVSGLLVVVAAAGCTDPNKFQAPEAATASDPKIIKEDFRPNAPAGVAIKEPPPGGPMWASLIKSRSFSSRIDPFALQPRERTYENSQGTERFAAQDSWRLDFIPAVDTVVIPQVEPQPYRRLAGVIVGDSVLALIDMGDGKLELIHPGQVINGWRVVSIDGDKAILRRGGNRLPHEITVRLEEPPFGGGGGGGGGAPPPGNNNPGPGVQPPGNPGTRGGRTGGGGGAG